MSSLGVYGTSVITAIVAQRPGKVLSIQPVDPQVLDDQLSELLATYPIAAIKLGMLANVEIVERLVEQLTKVKDQIPIVIDPVIQATAGATLLETGALPLVRESLLPLATLMTPNLPEAETLLSQNISTHEEQSACYQLAQQFGCAILLKGGHSDNPGGTITDYFAPTTTTSSKAIITLTSEKLDVPNLHGSGCHLSSAIAAGLAKGQPLIDAITSAQTHLRCSMQNYHSWENNDDSVFALGTIS